MFCNGSQVCQERSTGLSPSQIIQPFQNSLWKGSDPLLYCKFSLAWDQGSAPSGVPSFSFACLPLLTESQFIVFPLVQWCFSSLSFSSPRQSCSRQHAHQAWIQFPDRKPMDHRWYLPMAFAFGSVLPSQCPGIHPVHSFWCSRSWNIPKTVKNFNARSAIASLLWLLKTKTKWSPITFVSTWTEDSLFQRKSLPNDPPSSVFSFMVLSYSFHVQYEGSAIHSKQERLRPSSFLSDLFN